MMNYIKLNLLFLILLQLLAFGCDEDEMDTIQEPIVIVNNEPISGCTQNNACNYSSIAEVDDGSCYFCADCSGGTLISQNILQETDINLFDFNPSSPYYNQVFSLLNVSWTEDDYCSRVERDFWITFKNVTNKTITFDYYIESNGDGNIRSKQGFIQNLAPGDNFTKSVGDKAFWNLNVYPLQVLINNIQYID